MSDDRNCRLRVLILLGTAYFPPFTDDLGELHRKGMGPRTWLLELPFELTQLDQRFLTGPPAWLLAFYRRIPIWAAETLEAFRVRRHYDVVLSWTATALLLALLLKFTRARTPLVALFSWISQPAKSWLLRLVQSHITTLILPPPTQYDFAVKNLRLPAAKVACFPWAVDDQFWRSPPEVIPDMICSAGREMRDFETLIEALDGTGIRCHIAGALVRGKNDQWRRALGDRGEKVNLPSNVTIGPKDPVELRELYAHSRFVVLPLHRSDTDNGITCLMEAWSMSRPVICSQIAGLRNVLDHGWNGLFVPPSDPVALRRAIVELWDHPEETARMGVEARRAVEEHRSMDRFIRQMSEVIREAAGSNIANRG